jgi:adenosine deaminase CECR1
MFCQGLVMALFMLALGACGSNSAPVHTPNNDEASFAFSADIALTPDEQAVDAILKVQRMRFLHRHAAEPDRPFSMSFMALRDELAHDDLYQTLKKMPKGGMLHIHATATGDTSWIVDRALSETECYIYWGARGGIYALGQLAFFNGEAVPEGWLRISDLKQSRADLRGELIALYTLGPEDAACPDIWEEFEAIFQRIDGFLSYRSIFVDYYTHAFERLAEDGVQFVELRTSVDSVIDEHGRYIEGEDVFALYRSALADVRKRYPDFDLRLIVCSYRWLSPEWTAQQLERTRTWMISAPDLVAGFDIVGEEDRGNSNAFYAAVFSAYPSVPLFLHGGESLSPSNFNIREAWMLGAKRISHGINLMFFPTLETLLRQSDVMLEVCPISNQALRYVLDPRLHPARGYLQRGLQCVLGSDDPSIFGTTGLTDDFWMAYVAWGLDIRSLKKLALNSILLSALPPELRQKQLDRFNVQWQRFITDVITGHSLNNLSETWRRVPIDTSMGRLTFHT